MVILEGTTMLQIGNNQYLQPDYLSPLPTTLDAKKSPLALLAQTCSQIGADSGNITVKSLVSPSEKNKKTSTSSTSSAASAENGMISNNSRSPSVKTEKSDASPELKLAFKPYEMNVLTTKVKNEDRPSSKMSSGSDVLNNNSVNHANNNNSGNDVKRENRTSSRGSAESPNRVGSVHMKAEGSDNGKNTPESSRKTSTPNDRDKSSSSPIVRSGVEVMHGGKDMSGYKPGVYGINPLTGLPSPSGIDHTNPAFRPPFAGAFSHHHAAMLAAAYPGAAAAAAGANPYLSYTRVKTPSGGETLVPICKDPYCTGCQFSAHNHQMMMGGQCPAGCTQCDHQKYSFAMAMGALPPGYAYPPAATQPGRPYMCNWVIGDSYCGKRFNTTDELLSHLRTHTANLSDPAALALQQQLMPLSGIFPPSSMHRGYPNPQLSPLSAARYHPYAKPGALPTALPGTPYGAAFNPAAFGQYYSPYAAALYSQRMGAAVHQ
ncbi:zinc finger protein Noc [Toxorhynchites rutilus septentrionalis]|uniref:zinc finger protein Noc n=1 Tax=Toxorhynchites rutilus septentrionalis TaxID=329112 RepID=UPI00247A329E|nr:zinc finger protein Noc [Toxorhynchites rutilus septentrionalis]